MKELIRRLTRRGAQGPQEGPSGPQETPGVEAQPSAPKPPPELPPFFMLSHLEDDGPVRLDGVKLGVCEVMGLEIDEPKLGAFAGALNALDFPAQLLISASTRRVWEGCGRSSDRPSRSGLPPQTRAAAESLGRLLTDLEASDGILDRRFYAVCEFARIDDLRGLLARAGLAVHPLRGRQLRMFLVSAALGGSPAEFDEETPVEVEIGRRDLRVGDRLVRSLHLGRWPRSLAPGFLQGTDVGGGADGPVRPRRPDTGGAGGPHPGVAEGALRVGPVPLIETGPHHVARGGDRPGGHHPAQGRGAARAGSGSSTPRCL